MLSSVFTDENFLNHLKNYATYTFLRSLSAKSDSSNSNPQTFSQEDFQQYQPLFLDCMRYLDQLSEGQRAELFSHSRQTQMYAVSIPLKEEGHPGYNGEESSAAVSVPISTLMQNMQSDYNLYTAFMGEGDSELLLPEDSNQTENLEIRRRSGVRPRPKDIFSVHSSAPVYDIGETIARGGFTLGQDAKFPTTRIVGGTQGRIDILPFWDHKTNQPLTPQNINLAVHSDYSEFYTMQEEAMRIATSYNEEMATYFYAMDAYWLMKARDADDYVELQIADLLQYTGKKPVKTHGKYTGTYRGDQLQRAGMMVYGMGFSMVEIERAIVKGVGERTHYKRLWDVSDMYLMQTLDDEKYIESMTYRPNELLRNASFGNRRETALLMSKVLSLDYAKMVVARRLGRYYTWLWRDRARSGKMDAPVTCHRLLERAGVEIEKGKERYARRSLENALDRLETEGIISQWVLLDEENNPANLDTRISFSRWLDMKISVLPPDVILLHYVSNLSLPEPEESGEVKVDLTLLNAERKRLGYTLAMLSEETGVELSTLSRIAAGKTRRPRTEHVKAINKWLQKNRNKN